MGQTCEWCTSLTVHLSAFSLEAIPNDKGAGKRVQLCVQERRGKWLPVNIKDIINSVAPEYPVTGSYYFGHSIGIVAWDSGWSISSQIKVWRRFLKEKEVKVRSGERSKGEPRRKRDSGWWWVLIQ